MPTGEVSVPWRRDPDRLRRRVEDWFAQAMPSGQRPSVGTLDAPPSTGMSSETLLVDVRWSDGESAGERHFALRLAPDPGHWPVFPTYDLETQWRCIRAVSANSSVPVPDAPWYEPDPGWLGAPFLVMARVEGVAPPDIPPYVLGGWLLDASEGDRQRVQRAAVEVLAGIHSVTPSRADLSFLEASVGGGDHLAWQLDGQRAYYEWAREGVRYPLIEECLDWLDAHRPASGPTVLNWGDARIGNILFRDFRPVAVLDWEMAALGPAETDVAWMIWLHRFFQDLADRYGRGGLPDFMRRGDVIAHYQAVSGTTLDDLKWFEVFAALRHAIITVRTALRSVAFGQAEVPSDPEEVIVFRHLISRMLDGIYWN